MLGYFPRSRIHWDDEHLPHGKAGNRPQMWCYVEDQQTLPMQHQAELDVLYWLPVRYLVRSPALIRLPLPSIE